jgi:hypothetical protein
MPIVVHFMKRDNFVLWCAHFVSYDNETDHFGSVDRNFGTKDRPVYVEKARWSQTS